MIKYIEDHPDFIQPVSRQKEMIKQLLKTGIRGPGVYQEPVLIGEFQCHLIKNMLFTYG